jgi:hypothetical protein
MVGPIAVNSARWKRKDGDLVPRKDGEGVRVDELNGADIKNAPADLALAADGSGGLRFIDLSYASDAYGVCYDLDTGEFTRLGTLAAISATYDTSYKPLSNVPDLLLPIQRNMRRCLLKDDRTVNYYCSATDTTKKANGEAAVLDGTDGQVMVEIPAHWWKFERIGNKLYWWVAPTEKTGYGWNYFPKNYYGTYEGQLYDHSAGSIVGGQGGADTANDKLCSVSGVEAHTDETIVEYRDIATNRGTGWYQQANHIDAAVARLYLIEYASFDTQSKISEGLTNASSGDWGAYNGYCPLHAAGITNSLGNTSGEVALNIENFVDGTGTLSTQAMSYRGIENWYGHLWKWLDGANVHNSLASGSRLYLCSDPANFASDTSTNYELVGTLPQTANYYDVLPLDNGFYPSTTVKGSTTGLCDYFYTAYPAEGWRVVAVGGAASYGVLAGAFCVLSLSASSYDHSYFGGRLCAAAGE